MQFRVIVVTDPQTHPQTDKTDYNTVLLSLACSVKRYQLPQTGIALFNQ